MSLNRLHVSPGRTHHWQKEDSTLRYCEVISGRLELRCEGRSSTLGPGAVLVIRPGMTCSIENRRYAEAVLSCHSYSDYSLAPGG